MPMQAVWPGDPAPVAVIDVGSNSVRLVVFAGPARTPTPMFNEKVLCALGKGLSETGQLNQDGVDLAIVTLKRFVALARRMRVADIQIVATAAARDASNGAAFIADAEKQCGVPLRLLSGAEEASMSALGVVSGIPQADGLMGDLGGGSLELVPLDRGVPGEGATLPLGPLRLAGIKDFDTMRDRIDSYIVSAKGLARARGRTLYVVGGAWRGIARIHMAQTSYPLRIIHHYRLAVDEAEQISRLLSRQSKDSLARLAGVSRRRVDTLPVAALVLRRLIRAAQPREVVFSAHGLREGLMYAALPERIRREDPLHAACRDIAAREGRFGEHGAELDAFIAPLFGDEKPAPARIRMAVSLLSDIAWRMHPDHRGEYVLNRILNGPFGGVDHAERAFLAVALFARYTGTIDAPEFTAILNLMDEFARARALQIGLALRLAQTFSGGTAGVLENTRLRQGPVNLVLDVAEEAAMLVADVIERRLEALARVMGRNPEIRIGGRKR